MSKGNQAIRYAFQVGYKTDGHGNIYNPKGRKFKLSTPSSGYLIFGVFRDGKQTTVAAHRFIAYCKYGEKALEAQCVRHLDGDKTNNSANNIAIGTLRENFFDIPLEKRREMYQGKGRFSEEEVMDLRRRRSDGWSLNELGDKYGISFSMAGMIARGDCYAEYPLVGDLE